MVRSRVVCVSVCEWMDGCVCVVCVGGVCVCEWCGVSWCRFVSASACVHNVVLLLFLSPTY
jgi:hypothetical protein